jgi:hypothetical protein
MGKEDEMKMVRIVKGMRKKYKTRNKSKENK